MGKCTRLRWNKYCNSTIVMVTDAVTSYSQMLTSPTDATNRIIFGSCNNNFPQFFPKRTAPKNANMQCFHGNGQKMLRKFPGML